MATIRRRNNKWQVIIRKDNFKITYKTFSLKEDAVRWARETEVKIEQGLYQDLTLSKTTKLKDVLAQYRDRVSVNKKGHDQERYKINKIIRSDIADKTLSQLTPLILFEFIEQQKKLYTASTLDDYLRDKYSAPIAAEQPKAERGYGLMSLFRNKV